MKKVLILGANGKIARWVVDSLSCEKNIEMTLLVHKMPNNKKWNDKNVIVGDVFDEDLMRKITTEQDIIYVNLSGEVDKQMKIIIESMKKNGVKRIINISSLGVHDEVPGKFGKWNNRELVNYLPPYKRAVALLENSDLDYTVIRPAWLTNYDEINYELTKKGQSFKGTEVSRKSVADLVVKIIKNPEKMIKADLGVNKPNTDGDKPAFV